MRLKEVLTWDLSENELTGTKINKKFKARLKSEKKVKDAEIHSQLFTN